VPRRRLIAGLVSTAVLAGTPACSARPNSGGPPSGGPTSGELTSGGRTSGRATPPDPDVALIASLRSAKVDLIGRYDAVIAASPLLESKLTVFRADHLAHLEALGGTVATPTPTPGGTGVSPRPSPSSTPNAALQAVAALAAAEHVAAAARPGQARQAHDPDLARLIAAIGGCEAAHGALLTSPAAGKS
jgi:ferritin-like protein